MRRRELLLLLAANMIAARAVRAQQKAMPVIAQLSASSPPANLGSLVRGPASSWLRDCSALRWFDRIHQ